MYGGPGDNPITDIITHNLPGFGDPYDGLIRSIGKHQYYGMVRKDLDSLCVKYMHAAPASDADRDEFRKGLEGLLHKLDS